jgi:flagellar biosynthesis protein FlhB
MKRNRILWKWLHVFMALFTLYLIYKFCAPYPIMQATLYLALGTFWLVDLLYVLFYRSEYPMLGMYVALIAGFTLCFLFFLWLGNTILKGLNFVFNTFNLDFHIGNLFSGIYQYIFSIPSLISGVALIIVALIWDNNVHYRLWNLFIKNHK